MNYYIQDNSNNKRRNHEYAYIKLTYTRLE